MSDDEHGGIKVTDKRRFTEGGEARGDMPASERAEHERKAEAPPVEKKDAGKARDLPSIDFATFILSLASSAQIHMGVIPNPVTGGTEKNLSVAKQTIDIIGVMQEKTKGNCTKDEERLIESVLYDLRMKYVELNK